jgi:hypothetical protein
MEPNFPTDNLYKFVAIFGLALILFSYFFLGKVLYESTHESIEANYLKMIHQFDAKAFIKNWPPGKTPLWKQLRAGKISKEKYEDLIRDYRELCEKEDKLAISLAKCDTFNTFRFLVFKFCMATMILGTILSGLGFFFWYTRLQKYQDEIVQNEAAKYKA